MENLQYSKILRSNWEIVALIMGIAILLVLVVSLLQPFQYAASTKILIIQKQELNTDAYTATKSAERIGKNLANIIFTSSFYNEVIESNSIFSDKFLQDSRERRKQWDKNVEVNVTPETGILEISAFDVDKSYAAQLVRSIAYVLVSKGSEYHGGGTSVEIKIVDDVFMSKYPQRPNIVLNSALAMLIGFLFGSALVILNAAKKINDIKTQNTDTRYNSYEIPQPETDQEWQKMRAQKINDFGFNSKEDRRKHFQGKRQTEIITMHDHLNQ
jgi:capsular polysaccharide biosynthesis protein